METRTIVKTDEQVAAERAEAQKDKSVKDGKPEGTEVEETEDHHE